MSMICTLHTITKPEADQLLANPESIGEFLGTRDQGGAGLSLEKSWHGLHFVLTGTAWEGEDPWRCLLGGQPVGDIDVGYGPARILLPGYVAELAPALGGLSAQEFDKRFDLERMAELEIYPSIWDENRDDLLEEYRSYFGELTRFVGEAARRREGVLIVLN